MPHSDHEDLQKPSEIKVIPVKHEDGKKCNFGAEVWGVDLNNFNDDDFQIIEEALYKYKVLSFRDQKEMLHPSQQFKLTKCFDEHSSGAFAHGDEPTYIVHNGIEFKGHSRRIALPIQPQVHLIGKGRVPPNYFGFPDNFEIVGAGHRMFHKEPYLSKEESEEGQSRFFQWHFDGALYDICPPRVGCLLAVRMPVGDDLCVRWDDGTGTTMKSPPGATGFIAGSQALASLPDDLRAIVLNSRIEYAPHAFKWMSTAHSTNLGHTLETEGLEMPADKLPPVEDSKRKIYPLVWTNPKTGEQSLQVHGQGALKLYLKESPDDAEKIVDDLGEVRKFMDRIMRPAIEPENIFVHNYKEKDVVLWYNRALWHSIMEFPDAYGPRVMHQCNIAASDDPK